MNRMQLNEGASNRRMVLSERSVGVALFCLYIFISSLANDMVFPSSIGSLTLYLFLGYSVLYILLNKKLKINRIIKWMLVFIAFCVFTMLYSPEKGFLSDSEFYLLIVNFILILFLSQYDININDIKKIKNEE